MGIRERVERSAVRHLPIVSGLLEVNPAARRFLGFMLFNVVSWHCLAQTVLVLLARQINMPISYVGVLQAIVPLTMLLVVVTGPLVERLGPKRLLLSMWIGRNLAVMPTLAMPWVIARWGEPAGWLLLALSTLGFCTFRSTGAGGWFPWLHELLHEKERGTYFSTEAAIAQVAGVSVAFGAAIFLSESASLPRFLGIYGAGIVAGFIGTGLMARIPGGAPSTSNKPFGRLYGESRRAMGRALSDRSYRHFFLMAALGLCFMTCYGSAFVIYMRDALQMQPRHIMIVTGVGSVCIACTIRFWGRLADHLGSSHAMFLALFGHSAAVVSMLALYPGAPWTPYLIPVAMVTTMVTGTAYWSSAHRGLLAHVHEDYRVGYTNLWMMNCALALGITPIVVGFVIDRWGMAGFQACFAISGIGGLLCAVATYWIPEKDRPAPAPPRQVLRPSFPLWTLANIVWVSAGMHASNRTARPEEGK